MSLRSKGALLALLATLAALAAIVVGTASSAVKDPIIIGWAFDSKGNMAPFDGPALAAAQVRAKQINGRGGVNGRKLVIQTCDTNNNNPAKAKACAASLIGKGADIMFVTCDVEFSAPATQEAMGALEAFRTIPFNPADHPQEKEQIVQIYKTKVLPKAKK